MRVLQVRRFGMQWCALLMALILVGCGRYNGPAPVRYGGPAPSAPTVQSGPQSYIPPAPAETRPSPTRVERETYRAPPSPGIAEVRPGDTLHRISRRHGVSAGDLVHLNNLSPPYDLAPGRRLRLRLPRPKVHAVDAGDTVYGLARRYGVKQAALIRLNKIRPPYRLAVGQKLKIPAVEAVAVTPTPPDSRVVTASLPSPASQAKMPSAPTRAINPPPTYRRAARPAPPPRPAGAFRWPLRGKILVGFGDRGKGLHNDGINIAAKRGAAVRAAENGVVTYSGNQIRGFGNLILLKHAGGWTSAYAHNSKLLVRRGQRVRRGQVIARAGSTGSVNRPQLHFELRRGDNAVDPVKHLRKRPKRARRISRAPVPTGRPDPG